MSTSRSNWWGRYSVDRDLLARWQIGSLRLWARRTDRDLWLSHEWATDEAAAGWRFDNPEEEPDEDLHTERFSIDDDGIILTAAVADRTVVARPRSSLNIAPGHTGRIFVSSPLWVRIGTSTQDAVLVELSTRPLSETWIGATTRDGELGYSLKTSARSVADELLGASHRLLTPVTVENRAPTRLAIERVNLPVPFLSIYETQHALWSEEVHIVRTEEGELQELLVQAGAPPEASGAGLLSRPRQDPEKGHLFRAFGSLLGLD